MKAYILSILGIIILGVVLEGILPEGQMQKYIRGIYAVFVLFIIILPITNFIKNGYDIKAFFKYDVETINNEFLDYINKDKKDNLEVYLTNCLAQEGITKIQIYIQTENTTNFAVKNITINIKNMVIDKRIEHINKYDYVTNCLKKYIEIKEGQVVFNE